MKSKFTCAICGRETSAIAEEHPISGRYFVPEEKMFQAAFCDECRKRLKALLYDPPFEQCGDGLSNYFYERLAKLGRIDLIEP